MANCQQSSNVHPWLDSSLYPSGGMIDAASGSQGTGFDSSPNSAAPQINPWDILNLEGLEAVEHEIQSTPQQVIIEQSKINKNQYLTKLKRLLPTYFEDFQDERLEMALKEAEITTV